MAKKQAETKVDSALAPLFDWDVEDLQELHAAIAGLIDAKQSDPIVIDKDSEQTMPQANQQTRGNGYFEYKYIPRGKKKCGPYLYFRYRSGGKLRSKYRGKV